MLELCSFILLCTNILKCCFQIKVVRFIGELVKFGLYSKIEALYCLKILLHDFKHHHIEMACNLLETCGRFLYCSPDTHQRMAIYLQQMMRIKVNYSHAILTLSFCALLM